MARKNRGRGPKQQIRDAERRGAALQLRKRGLTYDQIAQELGYAHRSGPEKAVKQALEDLWVEPAEDVLKLEVGRLDAMLEGLTAPPAFDEHGRVVSGGAMHGVPTAVAAAVKLLERRAKYLGLDAPEVRDVRLTTEASPAEARRVMQELFGGNVGPDSEPDPLDGAPDHRGPPPGAPTH